MTFTVSQSAGANLSLTTKTVLLSGKDDSNFAVMDLS